MLFITPFFSQLPLQVLLWATAPALAAVAAFVLLKVMQEIDFRYEYLTERKVGVPIQILSLIGLLTLVLYHF